MLIEQEVFFEGLDFEPIEYEYGFGKRTCYKGPDGGFYRIDHFADLYVMEFASNEEEARLNVFEDGDTYYDADDDVIELIRADLIKYSNSNM